MKSLGARIIAGIAAAALGALGAPAVDAANEASSSPAEINYLLQAVEQSGCDFYRNGGWHAGAQARAHLARKYEAVQKQHPLRSTEAFIDEVASRSSASGEPYRVRCPGEPPVASDVWFRRVLARYRQGGSSR